MSKVQITPSAILNVPLQTYQKDFSFIVNGEEFKTSHIISDLISPRICKIHQQDPTIDTFTIKTQRQGDFSRILKLCEFQEIEYSSDELDFIVEVIEQLENDSITVEDSREEEITIENVFYNVKKHEQFSKFFYSRFEHEIEFISGHFNEILESNKEELKTLRIGTLIKIMNNENLRLESEDQLIQIINELYSNNSKYSILYETVKFENVSTECIKEFIGIYDPDEMTRGTWINLARRLQLEVEIVNEKSDRYEVKGIEFKPNSNSPFAGIIDHLRKQSNSNIENEISITASTIYSTGESYQPKTVILYENASNFFYSNNTPGSWLCFDFKGHHVVPTDYAIRSGPYGQGGSHMKSWKLEGSVNNESWDILDEESDCSYLNGHNNVHTFSIDQKKIKSAGYRYLRIKETGKNWRNDDHLSLNVIEFYGKLI